MSDTANREAALNQWAALEPHLAAGIRDAVRLLVDVAESPDRDRGLRERFVRGYLEHEGAMWRQPLSCASLSAEAREEAADMIIYCAARSLAFGRRDQAPAEDAA